MLSHDLFQKRQLTFNPHGQTNVDLQRYLQERITKHCHNVATLQVAKAEISRTEIEDAMHRVWVTAMPLGAS
jgi:hypothetical protein